MHKEIRLFVVISMCVAVPIIPFVLLHEVIESQIDRLIEHPPSPMIIFLFTIGLLGTDVFLPVPSSFVSTLAGGLLSLWGALAASWIGLTLGAALGFALGRRYGRPIAVRLSSEETLAQMGPFVDRYGTVMLIATRALPILAEATVLLVSISGMPWRKFLPPVLLSNLGIAIAYSVLGTYAAKNEMLVVALAVSLALPIFATGFIKTWLRHADS